MKKNMVYFVCFLAAFIFVACIPEEKPLGKLETKAVNESEGIATDSDAIATDSDAAISTEEVIAESETSLGRNDSSNETLQTGYTYTENIVIQFDKIGDAYFFPMTVDQFMGDINGYSQDFLMDSLVFSKVSVERDKVSFESDLGVTGVLTIDSDSQKISRIKMHISEEEIAKIKEEDTINFEIQMVPILMCLDPNISPKFAAMHLTDIGLAGMISDSDYVGPLGSIIYELKTKEGGKTLILSPVAE